MKFQNIFLTFATKFNQMPNIQSTLVFRWFEEVWNKGRESAIDEMLHPNIIAHGIGDNNKIEGKENFKEFYRAFNDQFENIHVEVKETISEQDLEVALCRVTATHRPTKNKVDFTGMAMVKINNGKITEGWNNFDFLSMNLQVGYKLQ